VRGAAALPIYVRLAACTHTPGNRSSSPPHLSVLPSLVHVFGEKHTYINGIRGEGSSSSSEDLMSTPSSASLPTPPNAVKHRYSQSDRAREDRWRYAQARGIRKISPQRLHASGKMWTPHAGSVVAGPLESLTNTCPVYPRNGSGAPAELAEQKQRPRELLRSHCLIKLSFEDVDASSSQVQTGTIVRLDQCLMHLMFGRPVQHKTSEIP